MNQFIFFSLGTHQFCITKIFFMKHLSIIYKTSGHHTGLIIRMAIALVMLPHGCQLAFGWFGGMGFNNSMQYLTAIEGLPWLLAFNVIFLQIAGSLLILFGCMGRFLGASMIVLFIGMIVTSHLQYGLFMNWMGSQAGEGFEFHLLAIGLCTALMAGGSGSYSIDRLLSRP